MKRSTIPFREGDTFNRLTVAEIPIKHNMNTPIPCVCVCGQRCSPRKYRLLNGITKSCGCLSIETARRIHCAHLKTHGMSASLEYSSWQHMIRRCTNTADDYYADYGGRGITVCDKWRNSFEAFLADIGPMPSGKYSIERLNNNGNYEPGNVAWATDHTQMRNTRRNRFVTVNGVTRCIKDWASFNKIDYGTIRHRLSSGVPPEVAVTLPANGTASRKAFLPYGKRRR
jgi:hypothetical protein